jgi:hypothetical protein
MITLSDSYGVVGCSSIINWRFACAKTRSDVIHWYAMFQPTAPYLRRSWITALKKARPKSSFLYAAGFVHASNASFSISVYVRVRLAFSPFGGSCVSLSDDCSAATGNAFVGIVVSHSRKSAWTFSASRRSSSSRSRRGSHDTDRWQFCRHTQCPFSRPSVMSFSAIGPCPWPSDTILSVSPATNPCAFASASRYCVGSAPDVRTNTIGVRGDESS